MKRVIVVGSSAAGLRAAEEIKAQDSSIEVTIFLNKGPLPYRPQLLADFIAGDIGQDQVCCQKQEEYSRKKIFLSDKSVVRFSLRKKCIVVEEKESFGFDALIIADMGVNALDMAKGAGKSGVFNLDRLEDVEKLQKVVPITDTVVLESDSLLALKMACAMQSENREIIWVVPGEQILASVLDETSAQVVRGLVEEHGVRVVDQNSIVEILGDMEAKAVRLHSGKVLASQIIVLGDAPQDLRLLKGSDLEMDKTVKVDAAYKTNMDDIFAVDRLCDVQVSACLKSSDAYEEILEQQGRVVAAGILGQEVEEKAPVAVSSFKIGEATVTLVGETVSKEGAESFDTREEESNIYKKVFFEEQKLVGAVLVNADGEKEKMLQFVRDQVDAAEIREAFSLQDDVPEQVEEGQSSPFEADDVEQERAVGGVASCEIQEENDGDGQG
ncbi:MAG: FAD-dependent oxidoreductase [Candidatus Omnitrophica bacterium]|nr:FAD-dependent oxidoreductase [Candidatus Omnitrophota bacterium]